MKHWTDYFQYKTKDIYINFMLAVDVSNHKFILLCFQGNFNKNLLDLSPKLL